MTPPSLSDMATTAANDPTPSSGGSGADEYEPFDVSGLPFVKRHPMTAIGGTAVALRYFPDQDDPSRGYAGFVVDDPFLGDMPGRQRVAIRDDETIEDNDGTPGKGDEVKLVNLDDEDTSGMPGGAGVTFGSNSFISQSFEEWPEQSEFDDLLYDDNDASRPVIKLTGSSGRSSIRTLDVHGQGNAQAKRNSDGDWVLNDSGYPVMNDALIQTHPDWYDDDVDDAPQPRFAAGQTQLRPDVEGTRVVVMLQRLARIRDGYDGNAYWSTIFAEMESDDRRQELAERYARRFNEGTDEDEPEKTADDFIGEVEVDGETVEMVRLQPTAEFERSEEIKQSQYTYVEDEWGHWPSTEELNERRREEGFDEIGQSE